jgi:hypothetical protein
MVSGVIGFTGSPFNDDSFGIAPTASYLGIDIILPIGASWKTPLSVLEVASSNIAREWPPTSVFELFEQVVGFLWRCCPPRRPLDLPRRGDGGDDGVGMESSVAEVGSGE